jgi:hypothetical protein
MENRKPPLNVRLFLTIGLLLITAPFIIANYVSIPDFFRGLSVGIGIGLEIVGVKKLKQWQNTNVAG